MANGYNGVSNAHLSARRWLVQRRRMLAPAPAGRGR